MRVTTPDMALDHIAAPRDTPARVDPRQKSRCGLSPFPQYWAPARTGAKPLCADCQAATGGRR